MSYEKYNNDKKMNKQAAALTYNKDLDIAPGILAMGKGIIADKIIEVAKEKNIPIKEDQDLIKYFWFLR